MPLTTNSKIALRFFFSIFVGVVVVGYSLFSARHIIKGPDIVIETPKNGEIVKDNFVEIKGKSENLNYITLNDRQIFIDDEGNFKEKLFLYSGENVLKMYGKDKFGREETQYIRVVAPEKENYPTVAFSPPISASSTASSTSSIKSL